MINFNCEYRMKFFFEKFQEDEKQSFECSFYMNEMLSRILFLLSTHLHYDFFSEIGAIYQYLRKARDFKLCPNISYEKSLSPTKCD